jgi:hypothetical protein
MEITGAIIGIWLKRAIDAVPGFLQASSLQTAKMYRVRSSQYRTQCSKK